MVVTDLVGVYLDSRAAISQEEVSEGWIHTNVDGMEGWMSASSTFLSA